MEPDGWFIICDESWAFMAREKAQARKTNDSLRSLVCFFIWICRFLFLCWLVCGGNKIKREPATGGLQRRKLAAVCHPDGQCQTTGNAFLIRVGDKRPVKTIGLTHQRTRDERERGKVMVQMPAGILTGSHVRGHIAIQHRRSYIEIC